MSRPIARRALFFQLLPLSLLCVTLAGASERRPTETLLRIDEIFAGANGDSRVQFIELQVRDAGHSRWELQREHDFTGWQARGSRPGSHTPGRYHPKPQMRHHARSRWRALKSDRDFTELRVRQPRWRTKRWRGESTGRVLVTMHDAAGDLTGTFDFPLPPSHGQWPNGPRLHAQSRYWMPRQSEVRTVLLATLAFEQQTGLEADYVMPPELAPVDGMVCVRHETAHHRAEPSNICVTYGNYQGLQQPDACGIPNGPPAPELHVAGLEPLSLARFQNAGPMDSFECPRVGPHNADFQLESPTPENSSGETATLAALPIERQGENLFRHEPFNGNGRTCLTCHVDGEAFGISPTGIADRFAAAPDEAMFVAEREPALEELENVCLMRGGDERGLILENVDGFAENPVFRAPPHLLNIRRTAPYGLSGHLPDLIAFSRGAVEQHFPRTLARNANPALGPVDFRVPSDFELAALEAFMEDIVFPADGNLSQVRMMEFAIEQGGERESIERGRLLVGGTLGKAHCFRCHGGPTRSKADGSLGTGAGNRTFDTGVSRLAQNDDDGCAGGPGDPTLPLPAEDARTREFETPPLIGVARTAPFFHDNSVSELRDAVAFYTRDEFASSPAGQLLPDPVIMSDQDIDDIVAFLKAVSLDPSESPQCNDGIDNDGDGMIDFAGDLGCSEPTDDSERELGLPCDDGIDNDGDRLIDFGEDPGCESPAYGSEGP